MKSAAICGIIAGIKLTELDLRSADAFWYKTEMSEEYQTSCVLLASDSSAQSASECPGKIPALH